MRRTTLAPPEIEFLELKSLMGNICWIEFKKGAAPSFLEFFKYNSMRTACLDLFLYSSTDNTGG